MIIKFILLLSLIACNKPSPIHMDAGESKPGMDAAVDPLVPKIAFSSNRNGAYDLFLMNLDGSDLEQLTINPNDDYFPSWSPDGTKLVFASNRSGITGLYIYNLEDSLITPLFLDNPNANVPAWSPDGASVIFSAYVDANFDIFSISILDHTVTRLTGDPTGNSGVAWSPNGTIYFVSNRSGAFEIHVMNSDGSDQRQVTSGSSILGKPSVSFDGTKLVYTRTIGRSTPPELVEFDLNTKDISVISDIGDSEPNLGNDGTSMVFTSGGLGNPEVMFLSPLDGTPVRLTNHPGIDGVAAIRPLSH